MLGGSVAFLLSAQPVQTNRAEEITKDLQIMSLLPSMLNFANSARVTN